MYSNIHSLRRVMAAMVLLLSCQTLSFGQDLKAKLPTDPNVKTGKLANGLVYYIRPNHKPEKKVELRLVVNAGSILEDDKQLGLAHFMEHMNFNGTKNFQKNDLVSYLQSIGVQFGADLNANTGFDRTVYILPIPTDKPENLEKGFQIIEDWAHNALLTDKDIDEERGVVLEESRLGKGAQMRMLNKYFPKLASGSLYAERLPIGKDDILKNFKYETIRSFYRDWYRPDLQAVVVVGDIDEATALKMITKHFGDLKNPANEKTRKYADVTPRLKPDAMVVTDKEATNNIMQIMFPYTKKHEATTVEDYVFDIKRELVIQMLNQRLSDLAQSSNPPFLFAGVNFDDLVHGHEAFSAFCVFGKDKAEAALNAVTGEMLKAKKYGFTENELELVKKEMMSNMEKTYNERTTTESKNYVEEYIRAYTEHEPYPGIDNEYSYYKKFLPSIKLAELNGLMGAWMNNPNTFSLITGPDKADAKLPTDAELLAMTEKGLKQDIKNTEEKVVATSLMSSKPKAGKVVSKETVAGFGATTYTLSNGIKVTIKPTDFKSDEILLKGVKKGGSNNYGASDKSNYNYSTQVVSSMGIGEFSPSDMDKVLAGKNVKVSMSINDVNDAISGSSTVKDMENMMQLLYLNMMQPRKDEALFKAFKEKQLMMVQYMSANPQAAFIDTMIKVMYDNNPLRRMVIPTSQDFDALTLDRSLEIYRNEFSSADGYQFFITGNVKAEEAIPLIETYLGSIPAANKPVAIKDNGLRPVKGSHTLKYNKGKEKKSMILANYYGEIPYSEDLSLKAQALAEILNIKVIEDLREKMGAIYGGGFRAQVSQEPYSRYSLALQLPCGPENVDKLMAAAAEEIKSLKANGPDAKDLDKVKSQWKEKYRTSVKENNYWNEKLENVVFWGRDKDRVLNYETWVDKLSTKDVQETAQRLFDGKNEFVSILYPES